MSRMDGNEIILPNFLNLSEHARPKFQTSNYLFPSKLGLRCKKFIELGPNNEPIIKKRFLFCTARKHKTPSFATDPNIWPLVPAPAMDVLIHSVASRFPVHLPRRVSRASFQQCAISVSSSAIYSAASSFSVSCYRVLIFVSSLISGRI